MQERSYYQSSAAEQVSFTIPRFQLPGGLRKAVRRADTSIANIDRVLSEPALPKKGLVFQAPSKSETIGMSAEKQPENYFLSAHWLRDNVAEEQKKPLSFSETPWYHLPGTGFWTKEQAAQLVRNTKGTMNDVAPKVLDLELSKVKQDTLAFVDEYLEQMVNLKFNLAWKNVNGEQRIVCPDYGNVLWESITDPMEREGAVYEAIAGNKKTGKEGLETKLRKAPNGSLAIAISNEGWSGLIDASGEPITFSETQIYLIKKDELGDLQAYTLRYKANILQNEELQRQLGSEVYEAPNHRERIKNLMKNTIIVTPNDADVAVKEGRKPVHDLADVVDLMQEVVGGRSEAFEGKTFDEMRHLINHPEAFMEPHPLIDPLINRFQEYARSEIINNQPVSDLEIKMQIAMAFTILQMNKLYRDEENMVKKLGVDIATHREGLSIRNAVMMLQAMAHNYKEQVKDLQERPGCSGGGIKNAGGSRYALNGNYIAANRKYVTSLGGVRVGQSQEDEKNEQKWFSCSECGWKASGPIGDAACGGCNFTKEQYKEKYGVVC